MTVHADLVGGDAVGEADPSAVIDDQDAVRLTVGHQAQEVALLLQGDGTVAVERRGLLGAARGAMAPDREQGGGDQGHGQQQDRQQAGQPGLADRQGLGPVDLHGHHPGRVVEPPAGDQHLHVAVVACLAEAAHSIEREGAGQFGRVLGIAARQGRGAVDRRRQVLHHVLAGAQQHGLQAALQAAGLAQQGIEFGGDLLDADDVAELGARHGPAL